MIDCSIIRDLLPLYEDDAVNEKTKEIVKKHISECSSCKEYYAHIRHVAHSLRSPEKNGGYHYSEIARRIRRQKLIFQSAGVVLLAATALSFLTRNDK